MDSPPDAASPSFKYLIKVFGNTTLYHGNTPCFGVKNWPEDGGGVFDKDKDCENVAGILLGYCSDNAARTANRRNLGIHLTSASVEQVNFAVQRIDWRDEDDGNRDGEHARDPHAVDIDVTATLWVESPSELSQEAAKWIGGEALMICAPDWDTPAHVDLDLVSFERLPDAAAVDPEGHLPTNPAQGAPGFHFETEARATIQLPSGEKPDFLAFSDWPQDPEEPNDRELARFAFELFQIATRDPELAAEAKGMHLALKDVGCREMSVKIIPSNAPGSIRAQVAMKLLTQTPEPLSPEQARWLAVQAFDILVPARALEPGSLDARPTQAVAAVEHKKTRKNRFG